MNPTRIGLAALGAFATYFALGGLLFGLFPPMRNEFAKYPAVYRSQEAMKGVMPAGMIAMLVGMVVLALLYAMLYRGGSGAAEGLRFGALMGIFAICAFTVHNHVNLNNRTEADHPAIPGVLRGMVAHWASDRTHLPARAVKSV
jgi:amino acid transporter